QRVLPSTPSVGSASLSLANYLRKEGGGVIGADQGQIEQFLRSHESEIKALLKNVGIAEGDPTKMAAGGHQTAKALGTLPPGDPLAGTVVGRFAAGLVAALTQPLPQGESVSPVRFGWMPQHRLGEDRGSRTANIAQEISPEAAANGLYEGVLENAA